jgi:hypothetical protein
LIAQSAPHTLYISVNNGGAVQSEYNIKHKKYMARKNTTYSAGALIARSLHHTRFTFPSTTAARSP